MLLSLGCYNYRSRAPLYACGGTFSHPNGRDDTLPYTAVTWQQLDNTVLQTDSPGSLSMKGWACQGPRILTAWEGGKVDVILHTKDPENCVQNAQVRRHDFLNPVALIGSLGACSVRQGLLTGSEHAFFYFQH